MPSRTNPIHEATRQSRWVLMQLGREVRVARTRNGQTQRQVGAAIGRSASRISRIEAGRVSRLSVAEVMTVAAAVGLKAWLKVFPGGRRPLDAAQLALLERFNRRLHSSWLRQIEVVVPLPGDLRAVDELIRNDGCSCAVEAITRFADVQAQVRAARAKQRDLEVDRLILLVSNTHANRRMLREAGPILQESFPIGTRPALRLLGSGRDPMGDCLVII
jgi:transcriptional regulator with XRE-family HTH domain